MQRYLRLFAVAFLLLATVTASSASTGLAPLPSRTSSVPAQDSAPPAGWQADAPSESIAVGEGKDTPAYLGDQVSLAPLDQPFQTEVEPNNTAATANALTSNDTVLRAYVYPNADVDFFSFTANAGDRVYAATMTSYTSNGSFDSTLSMIARDDTTVIATDTDDG